MSDQDLHPAFVLANRVIEARETHPIIKMQGNDFLLTDEALHRLIRLAYDASLMQEEGRFPSARLVCSRWEPKVRFGSNIPWDSPKVQDPDVIRRIAPIANRAGSALAIATVGPTDIRCIGLYEFSEIIDPIGRTAISNVWEMGETLSGPLLTVRIEGPGQIRAAFLPAQAFLLRGGQIRERRSWVAVPAVSTLFEVVGKSLHTRLSQIEHALIAKVLFNPSQSKNLLLQVWGHLLGITVASRHGGAIMICLEEVGDGIRDGYAASLNLGTILATAIGESLLDAGNSFQAFRRAWEGRRSMLFNVAEQLAGLSAVDGCVQLDAEMNLKSFGAKLHSKEAHDLPDELGGTGMRHRSAYEFCAEHNAIAFVVSQDGHLTVMASNTAQRPSVYKDVDPGVQWSQQ